MAKTLQEILAEKRKQLADKSKGFFRPEKIADGATVYRILPRWKDDSDGLEWWHDFGLHFIKMGAGKPTVELCEERAYGRPCEICAALDDAAGVADPDQAEMLKSAKSAQRFLVNAINVTEGKNEVKVYELASTLFMDIAAIAAENPEMTNLEDGFDIKIERTGSGKETRYSVVPSRKSRAISADLLSKAVNLDEVVAGERSALGQERALAAVGRIVGILPPAAGTTERDVTPAKALPPASKDEDMFGEADADDGFGDFEEAKADDFSEAKSELDDLDGLDDLVAGLD